MKRLLKKLEPILYYMAPHKKLAYWVAFLAIAENAFRLFLPLLYGKSVDFVVSDNNIRFAIYALLAWAFFSFIAEAIMRRKYYQSGKLAFLSYSGMVAKINSHVIRLPMKFHKDKKTGEVLGKISRSADYMDGAIEGWMFDMLPNLASAFVAFFVVAYIEWRIALAYAFLLVIYIYVTIKKTRPIVEEQKILNKTYEKITGDIFDRIGNVFNVKANTAEKYEAERIKKNYRKAFDPTMKQVFLWGSLMMWQDALFVLSFSLLFGIGIFFVDRSVITIGQFVSLLGYIYLMSGAVNRLGWNYKYMQEGLVTISRSHELLNEPTENYSSKDAPAGRISGRIEFENVSFSYGKEKILKNISLAVDSGQTVAFVGRSGEGKSTLVSLISRYNIPQSGRITVDGIDIQKFNLTALRQSIAVVPQEVELFNDTIGNNIRYARPEATDEEVIAAAKRAYCHGFIDKFPQKYGQTVGERGIKLSTGQKQRIAIARAVLRDPKILILDEATSALDSESETLVQKALEEITRDRTTFVIAHRLSTISQADLIIVLENGRIAEMGDHRELLTQGGVYKKLSELQQIRV